VQDLAYVLGTILFVVIGALFIAGCDRIIGPDDEALLEDLPADELPSDEVAA
jgi:hypothetical protein